SGTGGTSGAGTGGTGGTEPPGGEDEDGFRSLGGNIVLATNAVLSGATVAVTRASVVSGGDIVVRARNLSFIDAEVTNATATTGIGVGVTLAFNSVGWDS